MGTKVAFALSIIANSVPVRYKVAPLPKWPEEKSYLVCMTETYLDENDGICQFHYNTWL